MHDLRTFDGIGGPTLVSDAAEFSLRIPRHAMLELARACLRDLLHNGTVDQATDVVQLARDIVDNF